MENPLPVPRSGRIWKSKTDFFRPFRAAANEVGQGITPLYDPGLQRLPPDQPDLRELNDSLTALADIFPDVQPEVFRDMLTSLSDESRLQLVTEQLLQSKAKWVCGRWISRRKDVPSKPRTRAVSGAGARPSLHSNDLFRSEGYKLAVKTVLYQEYRNLSHSTIKGVLAEQNFSYHRARPILQDLAARSWRFSFSTLWTKRPPASDASWHPYVIWRPESSKEGSFTPAIKQTGSSELDHELHELFVSPIVDKQTKERLRSDHAIASDINEAEAREAEALFDCQCCYSSEPFEQIAVCDDGSHFLCLECVRRTVNEALYGQGWSRTTNLETATLRCFASASHACSGNLDQDSLRRALDKDLHGPDLWQDFQSRMTNEILLQSGLPLHKCPFCTYAEVDDLPSVDPRDLLVRWINRLGGTKFLNPAAVLAVLTIAVVKTMPFSFYFTILLMGIWATPPAQSVLSKSWSRVHRARRGLKFMCQNPSCSAVSCMRCSASWADPHVCFDSEQTSLRTAVEASATAAIKRTCPRCMLSFVKSSGCNKLVCNCGYIMCYVCRQEITSKEGYAHFCQHFRPNGGRCSECERCDLYGDEDEDNAIREAAEAAEKAWREKEGGAHSDKEANQAVVDALLGRTREQRWYEQWLDVVVNAVVIAH